MKRQSPGMTHATLMLALLVAPFCASDASAAIIAKETFDYSAGSPLSGLNGGTGFSGGWNHHTTTPGVITSTTYDYQVPEGALISGGNTGLEITASGSAYATSALTRTLSESHHDDEIFVSFIIRQNNVGVSALDRFNVWLGDTEAGGGPFGGFIQTSGSSFYIRPDAGTPATSSGANQPRFTIQTTYQIVMRFTKSNPGENGVYDQASLWVNPGTGSLGQPLLQASAIGLTSNAISQFSTVGIQIRNNHPSDKTFYFDHLVIGTEWNDVVPAIPEPTSLALTAIGLGWLLLRRSR